MNMGAKSSSTIVYRLAAYFGAAWIAVALAVLGCTTTLHPSIDVAGDDGGAGAGGEPPPSCELFRSAGREYFLCPEPTDHETAAVDCARRDATLAAIESQEENDFLAASSESLLMGDWWLGGTRNDALVWSWPDGTVFWRGGPDGTADSERCLAITPADDWNDRACAVAVPYICERAP
jgi:Lectin C-type domain